LADPSDGTVWQVGRELANDLMEICEPMANSVDNVPGGYAFVSPIDMTIVALNMRSDARPNTYNVQVIFAVGSILSVNPIRTMFHASGKSLFECVSVSYGVLHLF
jgi:hypothetical protein